jgi:hypothetical protein
VAVRLNANVEVAMLLFYFPQMIYKAILEMWTEKAKQPAPTIKRRAF